MKVMLRHADKAPKLFREDVISEPDLASGGVYVFVIDRKFAKVGSSHSMRVGIKAELAGFPKTVVNKKSLVEVFVLEEGIELKAERLTHKRRWIKFFYEKAPQGMLLNEVANPKKKFKFSFDPKKDAWTQNLECLVTLQTPRRKKYTINTNELMSLVDAKKSAGRTYFWVLDQLTELGWFTTGMGFFQPKTVPNTSANWKAFLKDKDTRKAFKNASAK